MVGIPKKRHPSGLFAEVWRAHNEMIDAIRALVPQAGRGVRINQTVNGWYLSLDLKAASNASEIGVKQYKLKSNLTDWLVCRTWDGTTEGATNILVAKPYELRRTPFDGLTITYLDEAAQPFDAAYDYTSNAQRTVTINGIEETQIIIPRYHADTGDSFSVIFGIEIGEAETGVTNVSILDLNVDGRAWAKA